MEDYDHRALIYVEDFELVIKHKDEDELFGSGMSRMPEEERLARLFARSNFESCMRNKDFFQQNCPKCGFAVRLACMHAWHHGACVSLCVNDPCN